MLSLFRSFGENENEVEDGDEDNDDVIDDNGTQGKIKSQNYRNSDGKLIVSHCIYC